MNIYVSHSRDFDYKEELYKPLRKSELSKIHNFIFPHENSDNPFPTKDLFQNKGCDLVLAEVSYPATGQGIELGWANLLNIPIICIYKKDHKTSGSLKILTDKFIEYEKAKDLMDNLTTILLAP